MNESMMQLTINGPSIMAIDDLRKRMELILILISLILIIIVVDMMRVRERTEQISTTHLITLINELITKQVNNYGTGYDFELTK